ncbi:PAS domain S-box protein [Flavobacterium sp.]|uniref:PAS domain S-box protein n=1 Tax=Flavobacterium sp. TaxID=239 RepID=UPI0038FD05AE
MSIETPIAEMLAERFLEEREIMKFKKLVDASFFEMCISNRIGELIYGNKKYLDFIGVDSLEEVIGNKWVKIISDNDRNRVVSGFSKYIQEREPNFYELVEYENLKTKKITVKKVVCSLIDNNGYGITLVDQDYILPPEFIQAKYP